MKIRIGMQCSKKPAIMTGAQVVLIGMRLLQWLSSGAMSVSLKLMVVMTQMAIPLLILFVLLSMSLVRIFDMAKTDRLIIRITPDLKSQLQAAAPQIIWEGGVALDLAVYPVAAYFAVA